MIGRILDALTATPPPSPKAVKEHRSTKRESVVITADDRVDTNWYKARLLAYENRLVYNFDEGYYSRNSTFRVAGPEWVVNELKEDIKRYKEEKAAAEEARDNEIITVARKYSQFLTAKAAEEEMLHLDLGYKVIKTTIRTVWYEVTGPRRMVTRLDARYKESY